MTKDKTIVAIVITVSEIVTVDTILGTTILDHDMETIPDMITSAINRTSVLFVAKECVLELIPELSLINRGHLSLSYPNFALWFSSHQY